MVQSTAAAIRRAYYTDNQEDAVVMWVDNLEASTFSANYAVLKQQLDEELRKTPRRKALESTRHRD